MKTAAWDADPDDLVFVDEYRPWGHYGWGWARRLRLHLAGVRNRLRLHLAGRGRTYRRRRTDED